MTMGYYSSVKRLKVKLPVPRKFRIFVKKNNTEENVKVVNEYEEISSVGSLFSYLFSLFVLMLFANAFVFLLLNALSIFVL